MTRDALMLADGMFDFLPWYSWLSIGLLILVIIGYKMYQKKMMG
jgi:hypothetical protein